MNFLPVFFHCTGPGVRAQLTILVCFKALARSARNNRAQIIHLHRETPLHILSSSHLSHILARCFSSVKLMSRREDFRDSPQIIILLGLNKLNLSLHGLFSPPLETCYETTVERVNNRTRDWGTVLLRQLTSRVLSKL